MAHVAKYSRGSTGSLTRHYERAKKENGEYIKFGNQQIDITKIHKNYNLAPDRNQLDFIKQRCSEVHCLNRKDVNVMCSWIVTAPKNLSNEENSKFFEECYSFLKNRYGGEKNVISAYVHMDEITPHLHFSFVPVVYDIKKDRDTVSAKIMLNRGDLKTFHTDLESYMTLIFGRELGLINDATKEGNRSIEELKRQSATHRLNEAKEIVKKNIELSQKNIENAKYEADKIIFKANQKVNQINSEMRTIDAEYKAKKIYVNTHINQNGIMNGVNIKKTITGKIKYELTPERFDELSTTYMDQIATQKMQISIEKSIDNYKRGTTYKNSIAMRNKLEKEIAELKKENKKLKEDNTEIISSINRVNKVFEENPEVKKAFFDTEKAMQQAESKHNQSFEMER